MKVREIDSRVTDVLQGAFGHDERSTGLHASQIWEDLDRQLNTKNRTPLELAKLEEYGTIGFMWERVLENVLAQLTVDKNPGRYLRPGEQFCDGIYLTPDYFDTDFAGDGSALMGVEEWKVRWCSVNKGDDLEKNFWKILVQIKAYCKVLVVTRARLRILFIVGNWRDDITPKLRTWELEFTQREIDDCWSILTGHAKRKGWL